MLKYICVHKLKIVLFEVCSRIKLGAQVLNLCVSFKSHVWVLTLFFCLYYVFKVLHLFHVYSSKCNTRVNQYFLYTEIRTDLNRLVIRDPEEMNWSEAEYLRCFNYALIYIQNVTVILSKATPAHKKSILKQWGLLVRGQKCSWQITHLSHFIEVVPHLKGHREPKKNLWTLLL